MVLLQPLPPAACCPLQPSPLHPDYLAVSSESPNSWQWYRPNFQAGWYKYVSSPKKALNAAPTAARLPRLWCIPV